jgi:hypothetical protein
MSECDGDAMSWRERGRLARARGASDEEGDDEGGSGGSWSAGSPSLPSFFLPFPSLPFLACTQAGRQAGTDGGRGGQSAGLRDSGSNGGRLYPSPVPPERVFRCSPSPLPSPLSSVSVSSSSSPPTRCWRWLLFGYFSGSDT